MSFFGAQLPFSSDHLFRLGYTTVQHNMSTATGQGGGAGLSEPSGQRTSSAASNRQRQRSLGIEQLQSNDQAVLLSAIDRLRREHIDADISIPQLVVCGNQSSGKSSVLEAIAGVPFPIGAGTTTRFATEIILRQATQERIEIRIIPSSEREGDIKSQIEGFRSSFMNAELADFGRIIKEAADYLHQLEPGTGFWKDWLRAEISGPSQPHLTLVDLPGIIQYDSGAQGDEQKILDLLHTYVENPRTIILAIIDALNDHQNQKILDIITTSARDRALGIITKPDGLRSGSDLERNVIRMAKNESIPLRLGWHCLCNLPHEETDRSASRRDEVERQFFAEGSWPQVSRRDVGIKNLRSKLSDQLFKSIVADLPELIAEMRHKQRVCKVHIKRLGPSRDTISDQRQYLSDVLNRLSRLIEDALVGDYERNEFEGFFDGSPDKGLRDRVTGETDKFVSEMRVRGKQYHICVNTNERDDRPP